jgi:HEAT repeat protein
MQQTTPPAATPPTAVPNPPEHATFREGGIATMDAAALIRILTDPNSTEFQKAKACQRIGELGPKEAVPALAALLGNEHLSGYARYGLETIGDPSADDALRLALTKLKGNQLIGVINSIGKRADAKAGVELGRMIYDSDANVARAAAAALGSIGGASSIQELQAAVSKTSGATRMAVADACLLRAERLLAEGKRDQALALYTSLSDADVPKQMHLAALQGIAREVESTGRQR